VCSTALKALAATMQILTLHLHMVLGHSPNTVYNNSATAIEEAGGPKIDMKYGRVDAAGPEGCTPDVCINYTACMQLHTYPHTALYTKHNE
jgi:hypothetical protein